MARTVKSQSKVFTSDLAFLEHKIVSTMDKISSIVGSSLGPNGRNVLIESDIAGIPNKNTKDGVSIFRALAANDPYEHLIIEQTRDAAIRTVNEAGDGPQPLYAKVLTPTGFIPMGEVKVGMDICGTNGSIQTVLGVYPKGSREIYKVVVADGREVECCSDHLWEVTTNYGVKKILTTETISKDFTKKNADNTDAYKYYLPITKSDFEDKELLLDPYLVGVILGDGSLSESGSVELSLGTKKKHIIDKLALPVGVTLNTKFVERKNAYRVKINGIRSAVQALGISNTLSHTKFIPKEYLFSSIESRKKLLQGLLDTDGYINDRGLFEFSTVSDSLKDDFLTLVRSLGYTINYKLHTREKDSGSYSDSPIHRIQQLVGYKYGEKIVDVIKTGEFTKMQCIKVSNPDNLYITDNFVVTHNTTTSTIISAALIKNLFAFCGQNRKYSPQRVTRNISAMIKDKIVPDLQASAIRVKNIKDRHLLEKVATISVNSDTDMAKSVMEAFELTGFSAASHVTIQELSGTSGMYDVKLIEGFPINKGYEDSIGKFHAAFINDQPNQRCTLDKPLFILFDGNLTDVLQIGDILTSIGERYVSGDADFKNVVIMAHNFSDSVLTWLAFNFPNPNTINVVPLATPMDGYANAQLNFLMDVSAFTGAKIFDMHNPLTTATPEDFGSNLEKIDIYRFRTTIVGEPDELNIQSRADEIRKQMTQSESKMEKIIFEERVGRLTNGIAQLRIYGASNGELKEKADRAEDAVCAIRAAINHGCLPGGCRALIDQVIKLNPDPDPIVQKILIPSLMAPFFKLLDNAGYTEEEVQDILLKLFQNKDLVFNVATAEFGKAKDMGVYDAAPAVIQALLSAAGIAGVMGTLGGIIVSPRDHQLERQEFLDAQNFEKSLENAGNFKNEADLRP